MLHKNCKTPQLPDSDLKKYMMKVQGETLPANSFEIVDAKEEKQKRKVKDSLVVLPSTVQKGKVLQSKKRAKNVNSDDSEDDVETVKAKELKTKVIQ